MSLAEVVAQGDRLESLKALRDALAESIDEAGPRDRASLSAQMTRVLAEISALEPKVKAGDEFDEIAARRVARGSVSSSRSARAK